MIDALKRAEKKCSARRIFDNKSRSLADLDAHSIAASDVEPRRVSAAFADAARSAGFRPNRARRRGTFDSDISWGTRARITRTCTRKRDGEAWRRWFAGDALAPGAGEAARDGLLKHGGAVAPDTLLRNVLGEDGLRKDHASGGIAPNPNAAFAELGVR